MSKEIFMFGDIEIEKFNFYRNKTPIFFIRKTFVQNCTPNVIL